MEMRSVHWQRTPDEFPGLPQSQPWPTAAPSEVGLDPAKLDSLADQIAKGEIKGIHSLLIVRHGKLAYERYFTGQDALWAFPIGTVVFDHETLHDVRSVSKSVVGVLVGIAHGEGALPDLDAPLASLFPD